MSSTMKPSYSAGSMTHGAVMFLAFGVYFPLAAILARYMRRMPKGGPNRWWWTVHAYLNAIGAGLLLVGFTVAIYISGGSQFTNSHKRLGLAILVLVLFQVAWGAALSALHLWKPQIRRDTLWLDWPHWIQGYVILILGFINIPLGLYQAANDFQASRVVDILYFVWFGLLVVLWAAVEVLYQVRGGNKEWQKGVPQEKTLSTKEEAYDLTDGEPTNTSGTSPTGLDATGHSTSTSRGSQELNARRT